jgi:hypothetical protein
VVEQAMRVLAGVKRIPVAGACTVVPRDSTGLAPRE